MVEADAVVIGAGVVGLAVGRALALAGRDVLVLEAGGRFGAETSARNSGVIHAGLYYPPGSAKARLCVAGRDRLYAYAAARGVPHRRCGKLIVAADAGEMPALAAIAANASASGVHDLVALDRAQASALEPELACAAALLSPSTGIVDAHALMLALLADMEAAGGALVLRTPVVGWTANGEGVELDVGGPEPMRLDARLVVNAAGHGAPRLLARLGGYPAERLPRQYFAKGSYFAFQGRSPFRHLVYPLPGVGHLGIHATLDLGGRLRFGPDFEWVESEHDLDVDPARAPALAGAIRRFWPGLPEDALTPDYAGVRPKLHGPSEPAADLRIEGPSDHGVPGLVNLLGIESPGLTACLAIAEEVVDIVGPSG